MRHGGVPGTWRRPYTGAHINLVGGGPKTQHGVKMLSSTLYDAIKAARATCTSMHRGLTSKYRSTAADGGATMRAPSYADR